MSRIVRPSNLAKLVVAVLGAVALVACSSQSPARSSGLPTAAGAPGVLAAQGVLGSYQLSFLSNVPYPYGPLQPVSCLVVGGPELALKAHVENSLGVPANRGNVTFEYCSYKGGPPNDITRADEAPTSACEVDHTGSWNHLLTMKVNEFGDAIMGFGFVRIPRTIGFRFRYAGQESGIANGVGGPADFTWKTDCSGS